MKSVRNVPVKNKTNARKAKSKWKLRDEQQQIKKRNTKTSYIKYTSFLLKIIWLIKIIALKTYL